MNKKSFLWGVSTSAYQIEGAWDEDGKSPSMWDSICHDYSFLEENGDIACDHYHLYKEDVQLMKKMGIKAYRFSIAWTRIIPNCDGAINQKGVSFYNDLINELIKNDIEPMVTLLHFDTPAMLEKVGGWLVKSTIDHFVEYAKVCFELFGDRVKKWVTINEPYIVANMYKMTAKMRGQNPAEAAFNSANNLMIANAYVIKAFRESSCNDGEIGHAPNLSMIYPENNDPATVENARIADLILNKWFLDPAIIGEYPKEVLELLKVNSISIAISDEEAKAMKENKVDFIGVNTYSRMIIHEEFDVLNYESNTMAMTDTKRDDVSKEYTEYDWEIYPKGMYDLLMYLKKDYNNPVVYITENGAAYKDEIIKDGVIQDDDRLNYLNMYITEMNHAIKDGCDIRGYMLWSFMDNFEWMKQYSIKMGIVHVDFTTQKRTIKKSGNWYANMIKGNK